jgi:ribonuclease P/MRP protein subunit POP1
MSVASSAHPSFISYSLLIHAHHLKERSNDILEMQNCLLRLSKKRSLISSIDESTTRKARRRTGSHKKYRVFKHAMKAKKQTSTPSRFSRRKFSLLLSTHSPSLKNANGNSWLQTHKWHAKRFKMRSLWGYSLPYHSASHGMKYMSHVLKKASVVHDMSYVQPIELQGSIDDLFTMLGHLTVSPLPTHSVTSVSHSFC